MPARKTAAKVEAPHKHAELEKKIASLEALVAGLKKELADHCKKSEEEHKKLASSCHSCCVDIKELKEKAPQSSGGDVDGLAKKLDALERRLDKFAPRRR